MRSAPTWLIVLLWYTLLVSVVAGALRDPMGALIAAVVALAILAPVLIARRRRADKREPT